jgi:D-alanyl-lipoteichoic acid acyltransferase DltB (MBOAT superfamily)
MNFASLEYIGFLIVVWLVYLVLKRRGQNFLLLAASYFFYSMWDWRFLSLILISTGVDYTIGRVLARTKNPRSRRAALIVSLIANLGLLGFFKYYGFFVDSAVVLLESVGFQANRPVLEVLLPVGISFYTFQTLSYTIDVYRGKMPACRSLLDFALFVAFFPQLVAGPIERASHLLPLIQNKRTVTRPDISRGLFLILLGLVKKLAIADGLARSVDAVFSTSADVSGLDVTLATYAFALQILCDFSAYTDIARGTSKLFGINLMINFNAPYLSNNPSDFWRRWHISLSTWLRDYLYIPLGGNRKGPVRTYINLMLTMVLGGLWHGAAWNFVLWGFYQGSMLCIFRVFDNPDRHKPPAPSPYELPKRMRVVGRRVLFRLATAALFFQLVCYGWLLFRAESLSDVVRLTAELFTADGWASMSFPRPPLAALLGVLLFVPWEAMTFFKGRATFYQSWTPFARGMLVGTLLILLAMGVNNDASTFIYFQF